MKSLASIWGLSHSGHVLAIGVTSFGLGVVDGAPLLGIWVPSGLSLSPTLSLSIKQHLSI